MTDLCQCKTHLLPSSKLNSPNFVNAVLRLRLAQVAHLFRDSLAEARDREPYDGAHIGVYEDVLDLSHRTRFGYVTEAVLEKLQFHTTKDLLRESCQLTSEPRPIVVAIGVWTVRNGSPFFTVVEESIPLDQNPLPHVKPVRLGDSRTMDEESISALKDLADKMKVSHLFSFE